MSDSEGVSEEIGEIGALVSDAAVSESTSVGADVLQPERSELSEHSEPSEPDAVLLGAREQARRALEEITGAQTIGTEAGHEVHDEHVLTLFFDAALPGYPGWRWAATLARVDEEPAVGVLEVALLPGEGAVVAPEWVPWSERLAHYRDMQGRQVADEIEASQAAVDELTDEDDLEDEDDLLDNDFSDFDAEINGVEIDEADDDDVDEADVDEADEEKV